MGEYDEPVSSLQRREQLEGGWSNSESICVPGKCWQRQMPWLPALLTILDVYVKEKWFVLFRVIRDFPGSPVVRKSCFHTGDTGSIPVGKLRSHMPCGKKKKKNRELYLESVSIKDCISFPHFFPRGTDFFHSSFVRWNLHEIWTGTCPRIFPALGSQHQFI